MNKLISNYIYNTLYQVLILLIPIITIPYVFRVLGPEGVGINAYSLSIVQVFMLFAVLGIPLYGNRQVAAVKKGGREVTSRNFWDVYLIQLISSIVFVILYLVFVFFYVENNQLIFYIQLLMLIASMLDISWLFIGLEELKKVVVRNTIVRLVALILIFTFVNSKEDLALYVLINVLTNVFGQILMWTQAFKYINPFRFKDIDLFGHIKPVMLIFLPQVIIQLYVIVDRILLGVLVSEIEVGFYEQALKIVKITLSIVTSVSTVMLPRMAAEFAQGNLAKIRSYSNIVVRFVLCTTLPMTVGLAGVAPTFTTWFFGDGYEKVGILIVIMSPIIVLIGLSNIFGMQILIPIQKQNKLTVSVSVGAIISIIINLILVRYMASMGTAIATLIAEFTVVLVQLFFVKGFINYKKLTKYFVNYGTVSLLMGLIIYLIGMTFKGPILFVTVAQIGIGCFFYFGVLLLFKDEFLLGIINKVFRRKG
ncbi:oligosaccharide flippase family protein [Bacillus cereus]|uniref:oligosaccharide flippase family protein n=1 Tax=Bacillus cereus TaxID=1396 RepID=UPI00240603E7|nr:oligosaccharide flippase family protein [Bacillus cereus]MDF9537084.1 oligosaccharide flippase family protein [Bacillus cereus]MDF9583935.1 oligosaccharide flippase family protein [Bacillus cereus]MDG1594170.1 oligosaccharide flippase family protein [Bacillus cereus]